MTTNHKISVFNSTKNSFSLMLYVDHGSLGVFTSIFSSLRAQAERGSVLIIPLIPKAGTREYALWHTDIYIYIYMFLSRREMPHLYSYSIGQRRSHVHT